jgi:hypothetical protein
MAINPITGLEEEEVIAEPAPVIAPQEPAPMNPAVREYLTKKFDLGEYTDENRKKLADDQGPDFKDRLAGVFSAIGAAAIGKDASAAANQQLQSAEASKRAKLAEFDKGRAHKISQYQMGKEMDRQTRYADPTSEESQLAQQLAVRMGYKGDPSAVTAERFKEFSPALSKLYEIEQKKLERSDLGKERASVKKEIADEKLQALMTPYGIANSIDDAKKLKEGHESKKNFDSKVNEMIALREKHGGGTLLDRDDVARGKQLSKDLLLEYKNMAKLGVLSAADEKIINAIIPADPLAYRSPIAALQGQDPILTTLKKFKDDSDKDFATRIATRTRSGIDDYAKGVDPREKPQGPLVVKVQAPDGSIRMIPQDKLNAALLAGGKLIESVADGK